MPENESQAPGGEGLLTDETRWAGPTVPGATHSENPMTFRIQTDSQQTTPVGGGRLPPDFSSRRIWWRLMSLVAALLLVLHLMSEAGNEKNWEWIWKLTSDDPDENPISRLTSRPTINTRLKSDESEPPDARLSVPGTEKMTLPTEADRRLDVELAWSAVFDRLPREDPERLFSFLYAVRSGKHAGGDAPGTESGAREPPGWRGTWERLEAAWQRVLEDATPRPEHEADPLPISPEMRASLTERAGRLADYWQQATQEVFTARNAQAARELQRVLDAIAMDQIRDDTVWRYDEKNIWFRFLEQLQALPPESLSAESVGKVSFVQLFKQPVEYRGKLVRIRGALRMAYRVPAPPNVLGIKHYTVFWLQPDGPENSPVAIYALGAPAGFPAIPDRNPAGASLALSERASVTGIFFKRWAYRATDGARLAPLVLANQIDWEWQPPAQELSDSQAISQLALGAGIAAVLSILFAVYIYRRT